MTARVRWLHLADFHFEGHRGGREPLSREILDVLDHRVSEGRGPDFVFITGDVASRGAASEYARFWGEFLEGLLHRLPPGARTRVFVVPGNHDVDRTATPSVRPNQMVDRLPGLLAPDAMGLSLRDWRLDKAEAQEHRGLPG